MQVSVVKKTTTTKQNKTLSPLWGIIGARKNATNMYIACVYSVLLVYFSIIYRLGKLLLLLSTVTKSEGDNVQVFKHSYLKDLSSRWQIETAVWTGSDHLKRFSPLQFNEF